MSGIQHYTGRIPACGCFCGGCPNFIREKNRCPGAGFSDRCEKCTSYHLCCKEKGITHCYECPQFPCPRFRGFSKRWQKHGQDFLENQRLLKEVGEEKFLRIWNDRAE